MLQIAALGYRGDKLHFIFCKDFQNMKADINTPLRCKFIVSTVVYIQTPGNTVSITTGKTRVNSGQKQDL